jgi:hypothetical protein
LHVLVRALPKSDDAALVPLAARAANAQLHGYAQTLAVAVRRRFGRPLCCRLDCSALLSSVSARTMSHARHAMVRCDAQVAAVGMYGIYESKESRGKPHLTSAHAQLGAASFIAAVVQLVVGAAMQYANALGLSGNQVLGSVMMIVCWSVVMPPGSSIVSSWARQRKSARRLHTLLAILTVAGVSGTFLLAAFTRASCCALLDLL